ncbi:XK-related protein 9 [Stegastes partitus]|uniref:XK-related protein n=1 Tax=Stegastes partitus TaxID=144197 RepID=A0A3B5AWZ7_9TELE|nr:PREDICTED: XK-related protein 9 [Stegastes partitus]
MMAQSDGQYSRRRWLFTILGLFLYVFDIWTDIGLALKYFQEGHYLWSGLTVMFVLTGLLVTQVFSCAWYWDDMSDALTYPERETTIQGLSKCELAVLHVCGIGIFTRYYLLLKKGIDVIWRPTNADTNEEKEVEHKKLFCMATDLSMLKLFEAFLENVPQLLLQIYILLGHDKGSAMQYLSMAFSFFSAAWALVDYRCCMRRSHPDIREMSSGLPTAIYLLYKVCTITSHILSYSLLLILSIYSTIALTVIWLLGTTWTHFLGTDFCKSRSLEMLYRAVIGVILMFTFFNVKGQNTKGEMTFYYFFYSVVNVAAPILLVFLKPGLEASTFLLVVIGLIFGGSVLGLVCLVMYYLFLHPKRESDEVDFASPGVVKETEATETVAMERVRNFLQP